MNNFNDKIIDLMLAYGDRESLTKRDEFEGYEMISIAVPENKVDNCIFKLRKLNIDGYIFFYSDKPHIKDYKYIFAIKTDDKFDILRAFETDGINYDITNDDIINRLLEWDKLHGVTIEGVALDFVDVQFKYITKDLGEFAKELYEFCPDCVDQGLGSLDELEECLDMFHRAFLWWD